VAGSCEYGDEPSGSGAMQLVTYSFQHINYMCCYNGSKSNDTSKGELMAYDTSVLLRDLLCYSWYSVVVTAYTVGCGPDANKTERTLELGNVFSDMWWIS
jgi:hypothetical protein